MLKTSINYQFTIQNKDQIDNSLEELQDLADGLINSKDAHTPEVLAQRKMLAEQINELLIVEEQVLARLKEIEIEQISNKLFSQEKHAQAHKLMSPIVEDIKKLKEPINFQVN